MATPEIVPRPAPAPAPDRSRFALGFAVVILVLATVAAYHNTFTAPFIFDDIPAIRDNPTIRDLRRPSDVLIPPQLRGAGVAGRPMVNLSLALNRAIGGEDVRGYHAFNLLVHIAAGLVLFGIVRRTRVAGVGRTLPFAFCVALLWLVHPLQTESVTCIIQRTESLGGLFFLLTLYAFVRHTQAAAPHARTWSIVCWAACVLGAATKELMAAAPLLVLLYDRTFVAGTFSDALRQRKGLYAALASTWLLIGLLIWQSDTRGGTVGFGRGVSSWEYLLTQARAIALYVKLSFWPHPLVLDYGTEVVRELGAVWWRGLLILGAVGATLWALVRRPALGFCGAWFFVILAPSSSVVPLVTQTIAEHRMYLPLAAIVVLVLASIWRVMGRANVAVCGGIAAVLLMATVARNAQYETAESIWRDTVAKVPANPRAHFTLAQLADEAGNHAAAARHGEAAVQLVPDDATAHFNLAFTLTRAGRLEDAVKHYEIAARLKPTSVDAHINLGAVLVRLGRLPAAAEHFERVVRARPESGEDHFNLAQVYLRSGREADALAHFELAAKLKPDSPEAQFGLGMAYVKLQRLEAALAAFRETVRLAPTHLLAHINLAGALMMLGRPSEAIPVYERALQLEPGNIVATANLAAARDLAQ